MLMATLWTWVRRVAALVLIAFYTSFTAADNTREVHIIKVAAAKPEFAIAQDYFVGLLKRALELGAEGRTVPVVQETRLIEQKQGLQEMIRGKIIDVYWMGTDTIREKKLRAIPIPLDRGLMGYRRFIIRRDMAQEFDSINTLNTLANYTACQGKDWPDTTVLEAAGLPVQEIVSFERMFQQLNLKHCDYFPRGFFEPYSELYVRQKIYPDLMLYDPLVLHYPFALYFFLNKDNEVLAQWIEQGLEKMIDSGEFIHYMQSHDLTRHAFPLHHLEEMRVIDLKNPNIPATTNYKNQRYWFQPDDFNHRHH